MIWTTPSCYQGRCTNHQAMERVWRDSGNKKDNYTLKKRSVKQQPDSTGQEALHGERRTKGGNAKPYTSHNAKTSWFNTNVLFPMKQLQRNPFSPLSAPEIPFPAPAAYTFMPQAVVVFFIIYLPSHNLNTFLLATTSRTSSLYCYKAIPTVFIYTTVIIVNSCVR